MTPEERYRYDVSGYLLIEDAIEPDALTKLNQRLDLWEQKAVAQHQQMSETVNPEVRYDDILNQEPSLLPLVTNPLTLPYIDEMVSRPRLKSTWLTFKFKGGTTTSHSNHTPSVTHNFYHFNGRIHHNLFQVFYAMRDIPPGGGSLQVIAGSHKANYPAPPDAALEEMWVEIPMKAGSVLLFTHDLRHRSLNRSAAVRRTVIFTYCPGVIANSFGGDTLYQRLFEEAAEGSWLKYLLRHPHGFQETYPKPEGRLYPLG
jgi:ectoine hydroxylase-related dioxygenase (phytanoyl-CoA dioxygenase family)